MSYKPGDIVFFIKHACELNKEYNEDHGFEVGNKYVITVVHDGVLGSSKHGKLYNVINVDGSYAGRVFEDEIELCSPKPVLNKSDCF